MNGSKAELLERVERRLAWERVRCLLDRLPDRELAEIVASEDPEALAAAGITRALIAAAVGYADELEPAELERRMTRLFELPDERKRRVCGYLEVTE